MGYMETTRYPNMKLMPYSVVLFCVITKSTQTPLPYAGLVTFTCKMSQLGSVMNGELFSAFSVIKKIAYEGKKFTELRDRVFVTSVFQWLKRVQNINEFEPQFG